MTKPLGIKLTKNPIIKQRGFNHPKPLVSLSTEFDSLGYEAIKVHGGKGERDRGGGWGQEKRENRTGGREKGKEEEEGREVGREA